MCTTLRARYVFPVIGEPIRDGGVCIGWDQIAACSSDVSCSGHDVIDLGNAAILPGLVNAHVHLNFSDLAAPLGHCGIRFVDWLRLVMEHRWQTREYSSAAGLSESLRAGVTTLGDIVPPGMPFALSQVGVTAFLELIAPTAARVAGALGMARLYLAEQLTRPCERRGLSPHAPYSVQPALLSAVVEMSQRHEIPVAMHLAESAEEIALMRDGGGPLREFLEELGAWDATTIPRGSRPLDYLRILAEAHRALIVHGNYLDDEEIAFIGANRERMSVAYCPRSHDWFCHRAYPLEKLMAAGAVVALGTDGRGSAPDLSVFDEMRFAARRHPGVAKTDILKMATLSGAQALGLESSIGSLSPGRRADLAIVALPDREAADPHELLFDAAASVVGCYCGGQPYVGNV